ncbi:MAG: outer membrane beta-barrel protein [Paludibacteraceae bacterium]|nr:outer membrane beta-barrel protein [Paludibacteraceae bacterium]
MKRTYFWCILCTLLFVTNPLMLAQHTLSGTILSKTDNAPVEMATVRLFQYQHIPNTIDPNTGKNTIDSTLIQGAQTAYDGIFILNNIPAGKYKLIISSVGFAERTQEIQMPNKHLDLPTIHLHEQVQHLAEVSVQGHAAEMTVKGDTIEYNTAAYQVSETATVEELLKKMNGVEVDKEGKVTINGEEIKSVRIDGKKFFGDDVQTATKNIPAEMIEKIQVIDEKSEMAKLTGFEDDDTERIINLSLKKNRKQGTFGNYSGALGMDLVGDNGNWFDYDQQFLSNDFRYGANIFTNLLLGESQTTIIAGANNTNEIRSGRGRGNWGGENAGITASENIGVNTNIDLTNRITKRDNTTSLLLGGDATFNHAQNDTRTRTNKESYTNEYTYINNDSTSKLSHSWNAQMRLELEYQIDTLNKLILRPTIGYTNNEGNSYNIYTFDRDTVIDTLNNVIRINDGYQQQFSLSENINAGLRAIYNHKFLRPGRSLTMQANINFTNTKGNTQTYSYDQLQQIATVDQRTLSGNNTYSYSLRTSYVEPIYENNHLLEMVLSLSGNNRISEKNQYTKDSITGDYSVYDSIYSNNLLNSLYSEQLELNYRWVQEKFDLMVGARAIAQQTHSRTYYGNTLARDTLYNNWNFSPNLNFRYRFERKKFARIIYRGTTQQPSITQMEPVRNNSDALNETVGNLGLQPAYRHNIFMMYSSFNQEKFSSFMTGLRATITEDALTNNTIYDQTGKRYMQTVNADIIPWNIGWDMMSNTPFANKMFQLHTRTAINYNERVAYILREQDAAQIEQMIDAGTMPLGKASHTGNLRVSSDIALRFTHKIVDIGIKNTNIYSLTRNSLNDQSKSSVGDWIITGDVTFHLPKQWNISTDIGFTGRYGYTGIDDPNEIMWNASIDKTWNNATLTLKVYDLLHDKKNIVQTIGEDYVSYKRFNTLPTYAMLTFTYKLNRMGGLKAKGAAAWQQQMIESGGRPPMPPR